MPEKELNKFEQIIQSEVSDVDLDNLLVSGEVSEIVGERVSEKIGNSFPKKQKTGFSQISQTISDLLFSSSQTKTTSQKIPSGRKTQEIEVKKAIIKKTRKLINKATKYQNEKHFSAHKLEQILLEIRNLQTLLASLVSVTTEKLENLYRKFVLRNL